MKWNQTRPSNLKEFISNEDIKENLLIYMNSCIKRNDSLDHILLYGQPGVGKTSLASVIANELNRKIEFVQGASIQTPKDVLNLFSLVTTNSIIFIDEFHEINSSCHELLLPILEDFVIDMQIGKDMNTKNIRMNLPKFTLIVSTNYLNKLSNALIDRFSIQFFLKEYKTSDIFLILKNISNRQKLTFQEKELKRISEISKGIPRIAINTLKRFYDYKLFNKEITIDYFLKKNNIYKYGLNQMDLIYLNSLDENKPLGLNTISQITNINKKVIELKIEPFLLKMKLIKKFNNGRKITIDGIKLIKESKDNKC